MSKRKFQTGETITSLDDLVKQPAVYHFIHSSPNNHWKYEHIGWVLGYQLHYVDNELRKGCFKKVIKIKGEEENDNTRNN